MRHRALLSEYVLQALKTDLAKRKRMGQVADPFFLVPG